MSKVYKVENGIVKRHGRPVAKIHEESIEWIDEDAKRFRLPVSKLVKEYREQDGAPTSDELPEHLRPIREVFPDAPEVWSGRGDKDPALVKWLYDNHPEFAAKRYKGRRTGRSKAEQSGKSITRQCVEAQRQAVSDFRSRLPCDPDAHEYIDQRVRREYIGAYSRVAGGGF